MKLHFLKKKISIVILIILLTICLFSGFIYVTYRVKKIIIISHEESVYGLQEIGGKNIILLDLEKLTPYLINQNQKFKNIHLEKKYPDTVIIQTEERIPVAQVRVGDKKIKIDSEGFVVNNSKVDMNTYLMPIYMKRNPVIAGNSADALVVKAIRYFQEFDKFSQNLEKITLDDQTNSYTLLTQSGISIIVPFSEDQTVISTSLQLILSRFRIEGKRVTKVNFLFDKPIITLANE